MIHSAERAGARRVYLIDEPMAAGIGCDMPVTEARGSLVVDIGGGTTEIAVLSLAGAIVSTSLRIAGDEMDDAIISHLRRHHNLLIGEQSAREDQTDHRLGLAYGPGAVDGGARRDSITGLPRRTTVTSIEVREALAHPVRLISESVRGILEESPPEISADLYDSGITLVGGRVSALRHVELHRGLHGRSRPSRGRSADRRGAGHRNLLGQAGRVQPRPRLQRRRLALAPARLRAGPQGPGPQRRARTGPRGDFSSWGELARAGR